MRTTSRVLTLLIVLLGAAGVSGQDYTMTASDETGAAGSSVTATLTIGHILPARGFSLGLTHDASIVSLTGIAQGAAVQATNGGAGADFFFVDTSPSGGPGGVVGCVISTAAPIEDIPAGASNEAALFDYDIAGGAGPGAISDLVFDDTLGSPPVAVVISIAGVSEIPVTTNGSVQVEVPPVSNLNCVLADLCSCEFDLSWTNGSALYDNIEIRENGNLIATLPGNSTSATVNTSGPGVSTLSVRAVANGLGSPDTDCSADCPTANPPAAPSGLMCTVDDATCIATLTWTNNDSYNFITISLDGNVVDTLGGGATGTTVQLPDFGTYEICLNGEGLCDLPFTEVCCMVTCTQQGTAFLRGDADGDGTFNGLSDALFALAFQFQGGPAPICMEAADADGDSTFNGLSDSLHILSHQFQGGPPPPAPYPACGLDPDPGTSLGCNPNGC